MSTFVETLKKRARQLKTETYAMYLAYRDPRVPLCARIFAGCVVGYAFSPIDLIPDFIPVLGYLDDLIIVPLVIVLAHKMIPAPVMVECRARAQELADQGKPVNRITAAIIIGVWLLLAALGIFIVVRIL